MMKMKQLSASEFESFTSTFNVHSIYQTVEYAEIMNRQGMNSLFVGMVDENNSIVVNDSLV